MVVALLDIGLSATDIAISIVLVDELNKTPGGQAVLNGWNGFAMCYGLGRGSAALYASARNYYILAKAYRQKPGVLSQSQAAELDKSIQQAKEIVEEHGAGSLASADEEVAALGRGNASVFNHVPTSGAVITNEAKHGTYLLGSFKADLKYLLSELNYPEIAKVDFTFSVPIGQKFNLLNIAQSEYEHWVSNGGFFTKVNGPWIDAAVAQKQDIIVVSDVHELKNIYTTRVRNGVSEGELTGFGKEIHRLEWKYNYRFDPNTRMMVPPNKASGLKAITKKTDYTHN